MVAGGRAFAGAFTGGWCEPRRRVAWAALETGRALLLARISHVQAFWSVLVIIAGSGMALGMTGT